MQLNELHKEMEGAIPPTDCRLRPDIRAMENGDIGEKSLCLSLSFMRWGVRKCGDGLGDDRLSPLKTDLASQEKKRLEEKQRATRKTMAKCGEEWKTR